MPSPARQLSQLSCLQTFISSSSRSCAASVVCRAVVGPSLTQACTHIHTRGDAPHAHTSVGGSEHGGVHRTTRHREQAVKLQIAPHRRRTHSIK